MKTKNSAWTVQIEKKTYVVDDHLIYQEVIDLVELQISVNKWYIEVSH